MTTVAPPEPKPAAKAAPRGKALPADDAPRRELNVRLVLISLLVLAIVVPAAYFWHAFMFNRVAGPEIKQRVAQFEEEGNYRQAFRELAVYLRQFPDDVEAYIWQARLFNQWLDETDPAKRQGQQYEEAIRLLNTAVGRDPQNVELREQLAERLIEVGRHLPHHLSGAKDQAEELLRRDPQSAVGLRTLAMAAYLKSKLGVQGSQPIGQVVTLFERGLKLRPEDIDMATTLAHIYRKELTQPDNLRRAELADAVMNRLVESAPESPEAAVALFRYRQQHELSGAEEAMSRAVALGPDDYDVRLAAGEFALRQAIGRRQESDWTGADRFARLAEQHYQRAIELDTERDRAHLGLGQTYAVEGKAGKAIETWEKGLKAVGRENLDLNVQIVRTLLSLSQFDKVEAHLTRLNKELDKLQSKIGSQHLKAARNVIDYFRGKALAGQGKHSEAIRVLRRVLVTLDSGVTAGSAQRVREEHFDTVYTLAQSYQTLGQWDEAAAYLERAIAAKPNHAEARRRLAGIYRGPLNRPSRAQAVLAPLAQQEDGQQAGAWIQMVDASIRNQLRRPPENRQWQEVYDELTNPPPQLGGAWQLQLLKADYVAASLGSDGWETASQYLRVAEELHPDAIDLFQKLPLIYERLNRSAEADRTLESKLRILDDTGLRYVLVKAELLSMRRRYNEAIAVLEDFRSTLPERSQGPINYGLYQIQLQKGDIAEARKMLTKLHADRPQDATLLTQLCELALEARDYEAAEKWENELRQLDGDATARWRYYKALRLLDQAESIASDEFKEAKRLQEFVTDRRSNWASGHALKAQIAMLEKRNGDALASFQTAIELGEARVGVVQQYAALLMAAGKDEQAKQTLAAFTEYLGSPDTLDRMQIARHLQQGNQDDALKLAEQMVKLDPDDYTRRLVLAELHRQMGRGEDAKAAYQKALELNRDTIQTWNTFIAFLLRSGENDEAEKLLEEFAAAETQIDAVTRALFLGRGYELLGESDEADAHFAAAEEMVQADDVARRAEIGNYKARRDLDDGIAYFRQLADQFASNVSVQERLYQLQLAGDENQRREGEQGLRELAQSKSSPRYRRQHAQHLLRRGGAENRRQAIAIFEELTARPQDVAASDYVSLSNLYEQEGKVARARDALAKLTEVADPQAAHLGVAIEFFLRHEMINDARKYVDRLLETDPDSYGTASLQARWMKKSGQPESRIESELEQFAARKQAEAKGNAEQVQLAINMGRIYSSVDMHQLAMRWNQTLSNLDPEAYGPLADSWARLGQVGEAVDLCLSREATEDSPKAAIILANVLATSKASSANFQAGLPLLKRALAKYPQHIGLLFSVALAHANHGQAQQAADLYKQVIEINPRHVPALNNLAYVLLDLPGRERDAVAYIDQAIDIYGRRPELLDTKGMILLGQDPRQAVRLLEEATAVPMSDPRYHLHLAFAYQKTGIDSKARASLRAAEAAGLANEALTASEKRLLAELKQSLGS